MAVVLQSVLLAETQPSLSSGWHISGRGDASRQEQHFTFGAEADLAWSSRTIVGLDGDRTSDKHLPSQTPVLAPRVPMLPFSGTSHVSAIALQARSLRPPAETVGETGRGLYPCYNCLKKAKRGRPGGPAGSVPAGGHRV